MPSVKSVILLSLLCFAKSLFAQPLTFKILSLPEGLPQSQVTTLFIDSKSYVWTATKSGGLVRFDGKTFDSFGDKDGDIPRDAVLCAFEDPDHTLWFGSERGFYAWTNQFIFHPAGDARVNSITAWRDSLLLIGGSEGLYAFNKRTHAYNRIHEDDIGQVLTILPAATYWIGTTKGLYKLIPATSELQFVAKMIGQGIYAIEPNNEHQLWLASWNAGVILYNTSTSKIDTVYRHIDFRLPQTLLYADSILWIGTQDRGVIRLDLASSTHNTYGESEGLPHINVKSIIRDPYGQLWIGTHGGGIAVGTQQNFRHYDRREGIASNRVYGVITTPGYLSKTPEVWITAGDKVQHISPTAVITYDPDSLTHGAKCKSIIRDNQNRTWVGTEGRGVLIIDGNHIRLINHLQGLTDPYVQQLAIDTAGHIYIATFTQGLYKVNELTGGIIDIIPVPLPFRRTSTLVIDHQQRIWVGSFEGQILALLNGKPGARTIASTGLPNNPVRCIAFDNHNRIWAGTENRGIFFANTNGDSLAFQPLISSTSLNSNHIFQLVNDRQGNMWAGTEKGVNRISIDSEGKIAGITSFGKNEGFTGIETCHNAVAPDDNGQLWFGTMNGLMRYTAGEAVQNKLPPVIHFEDIQLYYKSLSATDYADNWNPATGRLNHETVFHYGDNHLSFHFRAIDLMRPDAIRYRWKLDGIDKTWSPPTDQPTVNYAGLQPGAYTLLVEAATDTTTWSEPISASFVIKPPYWQTTSFTLLLIAAITAFLFIGIYLWTYFVRKRERRKRQQLEAENTILQLEQKALQLQMNPHFLFNALTSIKALVGKGEIESAQSEINAFAQLMRGVLNNSRKPLISLKEEIDVLNQYLHIEQICHQDSFTYQITVHHEIATEEIEIPPMLIQPFVENAIVHGIRHRDDNGRIEIQFDVKDQLLLCEIRDNGIGREKAALLREEKKPGHQPVAIAVTTDRLQMMKPKDLPYEPIEITDITDAEGKVAGTRIMLRIPVKNSWN